MKTASPNSRSLVPLLLAALLASATHHANAATTVSNLGNSTAGELLVINAFGSSDTRANSFTTGSSAAELNSVTLKMRDALFAGGGFTVGIYSNGGVSGPGTLLSSLTGTGDPANAGNYTYTATVPVPLTANTTFFIVASVLPSATSVYAWAYTGNTSQTSSEGWTIENDSWASGNGGASWTKQVSVPAQFSVDATLVPEPSSTLLLGGGLFCLMLRRRTPRAC